jgi:Fe-S cluster assembly iron-binding protein IscA
VIAVLAISHDAAEVIKQVVSSAQVPDEGGIRISAQPIGEESVRLELSLATSPVPGDAVVGQEGANVFVEQTVAPLLDDKMLDAAVVESDKVAFSLVDQRQDWSNDGQPKNFDPRNIS